MSRRHQGLPPTRYGYLPPEDAVGTSWTCSDEDDCGRNGPEYPDERWPRRCPSCRKPIYTLHLEEPWARAAKRIELDARLSAGPESDDWAWTQCEDLVWQVEEALLNKDADTAEIRRRELDAIVLAAEADQPYFHGGGRRMSVIFAATEHQAWDLAMAEIRDWRATTRLENIETDQARSINARDLMQAMTSLLEDERAAQFPHRDELWEMTRALEPALRNELSSSAEETYARLNRAMSSAGNAREQATIAALQQLYEIDHEQGLIGEVFPLSTAMRLTVLGRRELAREKSGISSSLIWSVCLSPYMHYAQKHPGRLSRELANTLPGASGWTALGASRCLQEFVPQGEEDAAFWSVLDAAIDFMIDSSAGDRLTNRESTRLRNRNSNNVGRATYT